jgi:hypothetical protein
MTESFSDKLDPEQLAKLQAIAADPGEQLASAVPEEPLASAASEMPSSVVEIPTPSLTDKLYGFDEVIQSGEVPTVRQFDLVRFTLHKVHREHGAFRDASGNVIPSTLIQRLREAYRPGRWILDGEQHDVATVIIGARSVQELPDDIKLDIVDTYDLHAASRREISQAFSHAQKMARRRIELSDVIVDREGVRAAKRTRANEKPAARSDMTGSQTDEMSSSKPSGPQTSQENAKPLRKVSLRTLASIGGLAALQEVTFKQYSNGTYHFYGLDEQGKKYHISAADAFELYGHDRGFQGKRPQDAEVPVPDTAITDIDEARDRADTISFAMEKGGLTPAEAEALTDDELYNLLLDRHSAAAPISIASQTTSGSTPAATVVTVVSPPASAPTAGAHKMAVPPPRSSRWQQLKDVPHRWAIRGLEWVRRHRAETALGGLAVAAAVYGTTYLLTRDHSTAHNAIANLPPSGGGAASHDLTQQAVSSGNAAPSAANKDLIDSLVGQNDSAPVSNKDLVDALSGGNSTGSGATNKGLIDSLSGQSSTLPSGTHETNKALVDSLSGRTEGAEIAPKAMKLSLTHNGDSIWREVSHYLQANGYPHNDVAVDTVKDAVLQHMHLSESAAKDLPVGYHFTIPRAVLEELLKTKR